MQSEYPEEGGGLAGPEEKVTRLLVFLACCTSLFATFDDCILAASLSLYSFCACSFTYFSASVIGNFGMMTGRSASKAGVCS